MIPSVSDYGELQQSRALLQLLTGFRHESRRLELLTQHGWYILQQPIKHPAEGLVHGTEDGGDGRV
jgi:hypothetical protein